MIEFNKYNIFRCQSCSRIINNELEKTCGHCIFNDYSKFSYLPCFIDKKTSYINHETIKIDVSIQYKEYLLKIIKETNLESYFINLFSLLSKNSKKIIELSDYIYFFDLYLETSFKILKEKAFIVFKDINDFETSCTWNNHLDLYLSRFQKYFDSILDCINYDKKLQILLGISSSENPYFSEKAHLFLQNAVTVAFSNFNERFLENLDNKKYINFEYYKFSEACGLVIYLTPVGIINFKNNIKSITASNYHDYLEKLLSEINIKYCTTIELSRKFKSDSFLLLNSTMYSQKLPEKNIYFPESSELEYIKIFMKRLAILKQINYIKL